MENEITWPPEYNLRRSKRARRISLKICEYKGLEVVLPYGVAEHHAIELLESNRQWVIDTLNEVAARSQLIHKNDIPTQLELSAIEEVWAIEINFVESKYVRIIPRSKRKTLTMHGPKDAVDVFRKLLIKWLCVKAKKHFAPWLTQLSEEVNLNFYRLTVRAQKTRWGSCTCKNNINLNYKLLFMPPDYARHIMLHELCHTVHKNHSNDFWSLLQSLDKNCDVNDAQTRRFRTEVTSWLDKQFY